MSASPIRIRVEGEQVVITTPRGARTWWDWIALVQERRGARKVLAIGEPVETMQRYVREAGDLQVELRRALSLETFDFEIAVTFLSYVLAASQAERLWWTLLRRRRPVLYFDHPHLGEIPGRHRVALERFLLDNSRELFLNGVRVTPR